MTRIAIKNKINYVIQKENIYLHKLCSILILELEL